MVLVTDILMLNRPDAHVTRGASRTTPTESRFAFFPTEGRTASIVQHAFYSPSMWQNGGAATWNFIQRMPAPPAHIADEVRKARELAVGTTMQQGATTRTPTTLEHKEAMRMVHGASVKSLRELVHEAKRRDAANANLTSGLTATDSSKIANGRVKEPRRFEHGKLLHSRSSVDMESRSRKEYYTMLRDQQQSLLDLDTQIAKQLLRPRSRNQLDDNRIKILLEVCRKETGEARDLIRSVSAKSMKALPSPTPQPLNTVAFQNAAPKLPQRISGVETRGFMFDHTIKMNTHTSASDGQRVVFMPEHFMDVSRPPAHSLRNVWPTPPRLRR